MFGVFGSLRGLIWAVARGEVVMGKTGPSLAGLSRSRVRDRSELDTSWSSFFSLCRGGSAGTISGVGGTILGSGISVSFRGKVLPVGLVPFVETLRLIRDRERSFSGGIGFVSANGGIDDLGVI